MDISKHVTADTNFSPQHKCLSRRDIELLSKSTVPIPTNEAQRIFNLRQTDLLDSNINDPTFDRLTALARRLFDVPIALISLVDIDRQWFKSNIGKKFDSLTQSFI